MSRDDQIEGRTAAVAKRCLKEGAELQYACPCSSNCKLRELTLSDEPAEFDEEYEPLPADSPFCELCPDAPVVSRGEDGRWLLDILLRKK